ncbi:helix-turn-helix domain-containing protein [Agrobacterium pusense]|uniref:Helix-turn-helix domain-containing protein n=1 Tax=Agrobacterium pusense TaxID=648995 RepID=A0AA44EM16_9HYPH|nr:helix-turn-helix domain-containing protein [Agrobacterium pusense]NRF08692.1 helix-turn-helix domain-containing protein [Agrobacterium pusense]NRF20402.1 helix-turn-helix domain-containing protein [Agrobacterium pusense]
MTNETEPNDDLDLLWGAEEIGKALGRSMRATYEILDKGEIPAKKLNGRWVISRKRLVSFFTEAA